MILTENQQRNTHEISRSMLSYFEVDMHDMGIDLKVAAGRTYHLQGGWAPKKKENC